MTPPAGNTATRGFRADTAYDDVRALIVDGRLAPGSRIIETDLVDHLSVSRTTVRTALQKLEAEGLVMRLEGGRARWLVSPLTIDDLRELAEIMSALEGLVGRRAAELVPAVKKGLTDSLRQINEQLRAAGAGNPPDAGRAAELDGDFHRRILEAAAGPRLMAYCESLEGQVARYIRTYMAYLGRTAGDSADEHASIISAIDRGNPDAAEIAIQDNWIHSARRYTEVMQNVGERGSW
jgi:DNA-binding GntR family transcriptional regulator